MTTEDLKKALSQDTREKVDVNLGQVSLRSTISRGGQYNVVTQETPKENSFTQLSKALNQFPQLAGQFKNIQQQAGIEKVQGMSPMEIKEELQKRAEGGDESAKSFIYDLFQKEAVDEELYRQVLKTEVIPKLQTLEAELSNASPSEMNKILNSEDPIAELEKRYNDVIPGEVDAMVANSSHQKALHNEMLRRIPGLAGKTHATLIDNRRKFINSASQGNILMDDSSEWTNTPLDDSFGAVDLNNEDIPPLPGDDVTYNEGAGGSMLPSNDPFNTKPKDPVVNQEKPKLPRVAPAGPLVMPATLATFLKEPGSELNSLEQFMRGEADYVSVSANPAQQGDESILTEFSFVDKNGTTNNLENVPIKVESTTNAGKTSPKGFFGIVTEGISEAVKGAKYIQEGTAPETVVDKKPVKLTASQEVELDVNTLKQEREAKAYTHAFSNDNKYRRGVTDIQAGKNLDDPQKWREKVENSSLQFLQANIQENLNVTDTYLEQVKNGELTLDGKKYSNLYISRLQRMVDAEEKRQETTDESFGAELARAEQMKISKILIDAKKMTADQVQEELASSVIRAETLFNNNQIGKPERDDLIADANNKRELIGQFGITDDVDFYALIPNRETILQNLGKTDLSRKYQSSDSLVEAWESLGKDVSGLKVTQEDDWQGKAKDTWNTILYDAPQKTWLKASEKAARDIMKEYEQRGIKDPRLFNVTTEDGRELTIRELYRERLETYFKEEADKTSDNALEEIRKRAEKFRGEASAASLESKAGITILDDPKTVQLKLAASLEEREQKTDFLNESGRVTPTYDDETLEQAIERFNNTAADDEALALMKKQNSYDSIQKAQETVYRKTTAPQYYIGQAYKAAVFNRDKNFRKRDEHTAAVVARNKNIGLPMSVHREGASIRYGGFTAGAYSASKSIPAYSLNLNPEGISSDGKSKLPPLYSRKETPKTHIYSYYAARAGAYNDFDDLDELFKRYFPDGTEEQKIQFRTDQVELARKIGFGLPAKEKTPK